MRAPSSASVGKRGGAANGPFAWSIRSPVQNGASSHRIGNTQATR